MNESFIKRSAQFVLAAFLACTFLCPLEALASDRVEDQLLSDAASYRREEARRERMRQERRREEARREARRQERRREERRIDADG